VHTHMHMHTHTHTHQCTIISTTTAHAQTHDRYMTTHTHVHMRKHNHTQARMKEFLDTHPEFRTWVYICIYTYTYLGIYI